MSPWGWSPERSLGIWRHGAAWLRPFVAASPVISVALLILLLHVVSGTLTATEGTLFDLPSAAPTDAVSEAPVALVMPVPHETLVFFDDTRYLLGDDASVNALGDQLAKRFERASLKTLLVLADRRVTASELMRLAALAKERGVERILFAEKKSGTGE